MPGNQRRTLVAVLGLALLALLWFLLAPRALGGFTTLAIVDGASMLPTLERGQVVLLRARDEYAVGDIVGVRDPNFGGVLVVHRIIRAEEGRFVTQGDANGFEDAFEPGASEVEGRLWKRVPGVGGLVGWLFDEQHLAPAVGALVVVAMIGPLGVRRSKNERDTDAAVSDPLQAPLGHGALLAGLAGLVIFGAIFLAAMLTSTVQTVSSVALYTETSRLGYTRGPPVAGLYDGDRATTGDPVFLAAAQYLDLEAVYERSSEEQSEAIGVARLTAIVADDEGWQRTIALTSEVRIAGSGDRVSARLLLSDVRVLIDQREAISGVARREYQLTIAVHFETTGAVAEQPFVGTIGSELAFTLTEDRLFLTDRRLSRDEVGQASNTGEVERTFQVVNAIRFLGIEWDTRQARNVGAIGALTSLAFTLALGIFITSGLRRGEAARIQARYGPLLVPIDGQEATSDVLLIEVGDMQALARLAMRYQEPILHLVRGERHEYLIYRGERGYRYTTQEQSPRAPLDQPWGQSAKQHDVSGPQP